MRRKIHAHIDLCTLLPELQLQFALANLLFEQDLFSEYQDIVHVLRYSDLKLDDGHQLIIKSTHRLNGLRGVLCHPGRHCAKVSSLCNLGHLAKEW